MTERTPIAALHNVGLTSGYVHRLNSITLSLRAGRTAIVGFSGAGKSSLLSVLTGFEQPTHGSVEWIEPGSKFSLPVFWAPQDNGLWPHLTVRQHLEAVATDSSDSENQNRLDKSLSDFDLDHRESSYPSQLSKGEQNRLAVLRCLVANPAVLLLDEPLTHVDPKRQPHYWNLIENHVQETSASLIYATHQPEIAVAHSDDCLCLSDGKVDWFGPTQDLYDSAPSQQVAEYLGANNWFSEPEVRTFLQVSKQSVSCRPEKLNLTSSEASPLKVVNSVFSGSHAVTVVEHSEQKVQKEVIHRPPGDVLKPGDRVNLTIVSS